MLAAQSAGVRVPEALSVTGFDDLPQARFMLPDYSGYPHRGHRTARRRCAGRACIDQQPSAHRQVIEAPLVLRGSTAPPPAD